MNLSRPADFNPSVLRAWRRAGYNITPAMIREAEERQRPDRLTLLEQRVAALEAKVEERLAGSDCEAAA